MVNIFIVLFQHTATPYFIPLDCSAFVFGSRAFPAYREWHHVSSRAAACTKTWEGTNVLRNSERHCVTSRYQDFWKAYR